MRWLEVTYKGKRRTVLEVGADSRGPEVGYLCWQVGDRAGWRTMKRNDMLDMRLVAPQWAALPDSVLLGLDDTAPVPSEILTAALTRSTFAEHDATAASGEPPWPRKRLIVACVIALLFPAALVAWILWR